MPAGETETGRPTDWREFWIPIERDLFVRMRVLVREYFNKTQDAAQTVGLHMTFAKFAVEKAGFVLSDLRGADRLLLLSALGLPVKVAEGDWRSGPIGGWQRLFDVR